MQKAQKKMLDVCGKKKARNYSSSYSFILWLKRNTKGMRPKTKRIPHLLSTRISISAEIEAPVKYLVVRFDKENKNVAARMYKVLQKKKKKICKTTN